MFLFALVESGSLCSSLAIPFGKCLVKSTLWLYVYTSANSSTLFWPGYENSLPAPSRDFFSFPPSCRSVVVQAKKPLSGLTVNTVGSSGSSSALTSGSTPNIFAATSATPKSMINTTGKHRSDVSIPSNLTSSIMLLTGNFIRTDLLPKSRYNSHNRPLCC